MVGAIEAEKHQHVPLTIAHFVTVAKSIGPYALHGWIIVDSFMT